MVDLNIDRGRRAARRWEEAARCEQVSDLPSIDSGGVAGHYHPV